jgi:hypothetical protein
MKKFLLLSSALLIAMNAYAASSEYVEKSSRFNLIKGVTAALTLASSIPDVDAAKLVKPVNALQTAPDGFPMFMQYGEYIFNPAKISMLRITPGGNVYLSFENDLNLDFSFENNAEANQFVSEALFDNILVINSTSVPKK